MLHSKIIIGVCLSLLFTSETFAQSSSYEPTRLFSTEQLREDMDFFKKKLERIHPNLYAYTAKGNFDRYFDSLSNSINHPMSEQEFYNTIGLLNGKIKDGHTLMLPSNAATDHYSKLGRFFPFYIFYSDNKMYVNMNCTADTSLSPGTQLISINGIAVGEIMDQLMQRQIRDGNNTTYPFWILNTYFKSYYSFTFGHPDQFNISYKSGKTIETAVVMALTNDSITFYKQRYYSNRIMTNTAKQGITLELLPGNETAVLKIRDFHNNVLKDVYQQSFSKTINTCFDKLLENKVKNLILDIRDNQGGDIENGKLLISWLYNKAFNIIDAGPSSGLMQPAERTFDGPLYVLINGGSFSNSGIVSSFLEKTNRAVFIGEETGGNKTVIYGNSKSIVLPNTNINCEIAATRYLLRDNYTNDGHGIIPSYRVMPTISDITGGVDTVKNFAIGLVK